MPKKYPMEITRSAGSKESTSVSSKLRDDLLRKYFGYNDADIADISAKHPENNLIRITNDPNGETTDYEWENIYIPKHGTKTIVALTDEEVIFYTEFLNKSRLIFIEIEESPRNPIGQIGFLGNKAVIIVSSYDEYDINRDKKVDWNEYFLSYLDTLGLLNNSQFTKVALVAAMNQKVLKMDNEFHHKAMNIYLSFAVGLTMAGVYEVYLSQAVASTASLVGKRIIGDSLKRKFMIEKGAEKIVEEALKKLYQ